MVWTVSLLHAVKNAHGGTPECISLIMKKEKRGALINFTTAPLPCRLLSHTSALPLHTQIHTFSLVNPSATFTHMATHPRTGPIQLCQALWSSAYWWTLPVIYIKLLWRVLLIAGCSCLVTLLSPCELAAPSVSSFISKTSPGRRLRQFTASGATSLDAEEEERVIIAYSGHKN